jgi:hypothetical protein
MGYTQLVPVLLPHRAGHCALPADTPRYTTMQTPRQALLLALLLSLCCTLCCATSRILQEDVTLVPTSEVNPADANTQEPSCEWYPPVPKGFDYANWTAKWPQECMGVPLDRWCDANCKDG